MSEISPNQGTNPTFEFPPEEVKRVLQRTGFFMEADVARELRKRGYSVLQNENYLDNDENKAREMDIYGTKDHLTLDGMSQIKMKATARLVIECKRAEFGVAVIGQEKTLPSSMIDKSQVCFGKPNSIMVANTEFHRTFVGEARRSVGAFDYLEIEKVHPALTTPVMGRKLLQVQAQWGDKGEDPKRAQGAKPILAEACFPLAKAFKTLWPERPAPAEYNTARWYVSVPVLAVTGPIFLCETHHEEPSVKKVEAAVLYVEVADQGDLIKAPVVVIRTSGIGRFLDSVDAMLAHIIKGADDLAPEIAGALAGN